MFVSLKNDFFKLKKVALCYKTNKAWDWKLDYTTISCLSDVVSCNTQQTQNFIFAGIRPHDVFVYPLGTPADLHDFLIGDSKIASLKWDWLQPPKNLTREKQLQKMAGWIDHGHHVRLNSHNGIYHKSDPDHWSLMTLKLTIMAAKALCVVMLENTIVDPFMDVTKGTVWILCPLER